MTATSTLANQTRLGVPSKQWGADPMQEILTAAHPHDVVAMAGGRAAADGSGYYGYVHPTAVDDVIASVPARVEWVVTAHTTGKRVERPGRTLDGWRQVRFVMVPTLDEYRAMSCDERLRVFRAMGATVRPLYLRHLGWDEVEFLAESAFLSRDRVYRAQVITRLVELAEPWRVRAIAGYQRAAADQDAKRGYWAVAK